MKRLLLIFFLFFSSINNANQFEFLKPLKDILNSISNYTNNKPIHSAMVLYTFFWAKNRVVDYADKNPFWFTLWLGTLASKFFRNSDMTIWDIILLMPRQSIVVTVKSDLLGNDDGIE